VEAKSVRQLADAIVDLTVVRIRAYQFSDFVFRYRNGGKLPDSAAQQRRIAGQQMAKLHRTTLQIREPDLQIQICSAGNGGSVADQQLITVSNPGFFYSFICSPGITVRCSKSGAGCPEQQYCRFQ
jgi:hypothetical protein